MTTPIPEIKIFRAGRHTDADGEEREYTEEAVKRIADVYNGQRAHVAPAVKGHPRDDEPAHGWVDKLRYSGGELFATFREVTSDFAEELKAGRYKFRSIALYPSGLLKHVGFLGAVPPAVKGLGEIPQFADGVRCLFFADDAPHEESNSNQPTNKGQTQMDEQAQQQLTELITGLSASVKELLAELRAAKKPEGSQPPAGEKEEAKTEEGTPPASFSEQRDLEAKVRGLQQEVRAAQFREFLNGDGLKTRVTPAMQPKVITLLNCLADGEKTLKFSDAAGTEKEATAVDLFKELLSGLPVQYAEGELGNQGVPAVDAERSKEIEALAKHTSSRRI